MTTDVKTVNHWIGGKTVEGVSGNFGPVTDPATGAVTTQVAFADVDEVDAAVASAKAAYATWGTSSLAKRTAILFKFRALLDANRDAIAELITAEHGKVHSDALGEVARGLEIVDLACGITVQLKGELSTEVASRVDVSSIRQPLGVVAADHAVQLPGHGADVDVPARHRVRQHLRAEAVGEGPVGIHEDRRAALRGRSARRRLQRPAR